MKIDAIICLMLIKEYVYLPMPFVLPVRFYLHSSHSRRQRSVRHIDLLRQPCLGVLDATESWTEFAGSVLDAVTLLPASQNFYFGSSHEKSCQWTVQRLQGKVDIKTCADTLKYFRPKIIPIMICYKIHEVKIEKQPGVFMKVGGTITITNIYFITYAKRYFLIKNEFLESSNIGYLSICSIVGEGTVDEINK